jgi:hypothetical protein
MDESTRGTPIHQASELTSMGVFCAASGQNNWSAEAVLNKMFNRHLEQKEGKWVYVDADVYWDAGSANDRYTFFAYTPSDSLDADGKPVNGISVNGAKGDAGIPALKYTVPEDVALQPDLMVAVPKYNQRRSFKHIELNMKHALTCVGFQIAGHGEKITGISITGVSFEGTLAMNGGDVRWSGLQTPNAAKDFSASINYDAGKNFFTASPDMSAKLIADNGYLMMIPQTLTESAQIRISMDGGEVRQVKLNSQTWEPGKRVTYLISVTSEGVIELVPKELHLPYFSISETIQVNCMNPDGSENPTTTWTLKTESKWFNLSLDKYGTNAAPTLSGTGSATVYVIADENPTGSSERTDSIQLVNAPSAGVVKVTQHEHVVFPADQPGVPNPTFISYTGAFWRAQEKGERIIRIRVGDETGGNAGKWSAALIWTDDQWESGDGVLLAKFTQEDPNLFTDHPGNAELYPLNTTDTVVSGIAAVNGDIIFRIGLKSYFDAYSDNNPARYAVIMLAYNNHTKYQKIFVRQGEGDDYLMRPDDPPYSGDIVGRDYARRFSPFNLTDPKSGEGGTSIQDHSQITHADFVDYPSQSGYFFQWGHPGANNQRRAYHPANPGGGVDINGFSSSLVKNYWNTIKGANEVSPLNYHRPSDGPTDRDVSGNDISQSEIRQSLMLNPKTGSLVVISNSFWGYYADGFFDRRNTGPGMTIKSKVAETGGDVACIGRLFFNPNTYASLFFPAASFRYNDQGVLNTDFEVGNYWTSSIYSLTEGSAWVLNLFPSSAFHEMNYTNNAYSVRCVRD